MVTSASLVNLMLCPPSANLFPFPTTSHHALLPPSAQCLCSIFFPKYVPLGKPASPTGLQRWSSCGPAMLTFGIFMPGRLQMHSARFWKVLAYSVPADRLQIRHFPPQPCLTLPIRPSVPFLHLPVNRSRTYIAHCPILVSDHARLNPFW